MNHMPLRGYGRNFRLVASHNQQGLNNLDVLRLLCGRSAAQAMRLTRSGPGQPYNAENKWYVARDRAREHLLETVEDLDKTFAPLLGLASTSQTNP